MNTTCSVKAVCGDAQFPPEVLKLLIESCREPLVIKGQLGPWMNSRSWKIEDICRALGSKSTTFKVFPRRGTEIYRDFSVAKNKVPDETDCVFVSGAFEDFNRWWIANSSESQVLSQCYSSGSREKTSTSDMLVSSSSSVSGISSSSTDSKAESSSTSAEKSTGDELSRMPSTSATFLSLSFSTPQQPCSTSLLDFPARNFWVYADYNYLSKLCTEAPELLAAVDWSIFGFDQQTGQDSALWLGSVGAFTPCHQDTYGFNIVAQLSGEKTWTLNSPEDTQCMYPTRIPFEESSVFSEVDVVEPDYRKHPLHKLAKPYRVRWYSSLWALPGDVGPGKVTEIQWNLAILGLWIPAIHYYSQTFRHQMIDPSSYTLIMYPEIQPPH